MSESKEKDGLLNKTPTHHSPPPVYQQPQVVMQQPQQMVYENPPGDQLLMSLFTTFCCFMPLGIIALMKSMEARNAYQMGRHEESSAAILSAKSFNKWAIIINIIVLGVIAIFQVFWIVPFIIAVSTT